MELNKLKNRRFCHGERRWSHFLLPPLIQAVDAWVQPSCHPAKRIKINSIQPKKNPYPLIAYEKTLLIYRKRPEILWWTQKIQPVKRMSTRRRWQKTLAQTQNADTPFLLWSSLFINAAKMIFSLGALIHLVLFVWLFDGFVLV